MTRVVYPRNLKMFTSLPAVVPL
uniref:Uncharacterized protein n=1 Tax=Tetranychus urticae TaxID=32264 RepID=T1KHE0_TETUR